MAAQGFQLLPIINDSSFKKLQYIYHRESGLKIIVYPLHTNNTFLPDPNELCFYGQLFQWWHAFETSGIEEHQIGLINAALSWYADMKMYPQMLHQAIDPRTVHPRNLVN